MKPASTSSAGLGDTAVLGRRVRYNIAAGLKVIGRTKHLLKDLNPLRGDRKRKAGSSAAAQ